MKVSPRATHWSIVPSISPGPVAAPRGFDAVYRAFFHDCCRWLQAMGAPDGEVEDLAQEVFLVVQRKLDDEPIENLAGWIYRIARNIASDRRRRGWWRRLWSRHGTISGQEPDPGPTPLDDLERSERARQVRALLDRLAPRQRTALVLFEVLGYSGEEIAALEGIPIATVWTRLHYAREQFLKLASAERAREGGP